MTATIRTITRRANGRESTRTTEAPRNLLQIGRDTTCDVHLPDLRIGLKHARLTIADGSFLIESEGDNEFRVNGRLMRKFEARLGAPVVAQFGPYALKFSGEAGHLIIDVERVQQATPATHGDPEKVFSLKRTWLSKRTPSWIFVLLITAVFLAFPIAAYTLKKDAVPLATRTEAGQLWLSGDLSGPHKMLAKDCAACHEAAFVSVRDETCLSCHEDVNNHADHARMLRARGAPTQAQKGLRAVADTFNRPAGRCAECHMEHNGADGVAPASEASCTGCHAGMRTRLLDAAVDDASDFGRDHPEFHPTLVAMADARSPTLTRQWTIPELARARKQRDSLIAAPAATACDGFAIGQPNFRGLPHAGGAQGLPASAMAGDNSGLVFPHDVHLATKGCVASIAQRLGPAGGYGDHLVCKDCHKPDETGVGFEPVKMEENCSACHSLVFDNAGGFERKLRHGRTNDVIASLLDFYQARVVGAALGGGDEDRRRPGAAALRTADFRAQAFSQAGVRAAARVRAIFAEGGACYGCHVVTPPATPGGLDFKVAPVTLRANFLPEGAFNHRAHEIANKTCADCHDAQTSRTAADVLLPSIATCQECHGGEHAMAEVPSSCVMCHGFHSTDPGAKPMHPVGAEKQAVLAPDHGGDGRGLFR
jgi:hypothetical protein